MTKPPEWRSTVRNGLGTAADLATLIPVAVIVAIAAAGFLLSVPVVGLLVALALSIAANVLLAVAYARERARAATFETSEASVRSSLHNLEKAVATLSESKAPPVNQWITDHADLATLNVGNSQLESGLAAAQSVARQRLGPDADVRFGTFRLMGRYGRFQMDGYPEIHFNAYSANADRHALLTYSGVDEVCQVNSVERGKAYFISDDPCPWRLDSTWLSLIDASWLRMRPFAGDVHLQWSGHWQIRYQALADDERQLEICFRLDESGALTQC